MSVRLSRRALGGLIAAAGATALLGCGAADEDATGSATPLGGARRSALTHRATLLNVSYDATRELYVAINRAFGAQWGAQRRQGLRIFQSHGGSGQQASSIVNGLPADVATLGSAYDVMQLSRQGQLIPSNWAARLPFNSCPYTSTIVFLVRRGNPKNIRDWGDLVRPGVQAVLPNPKTSSGARWAYLAAWAWAAGQPQASNDSALTYLKGLYQHVPVLGSGARAATDTFVERDIGDVLLSWESEALRVQAAFGEGQFTIVAPSLSILAEPPVTLVDATVDRRGTRALAEAYLQFLYTPAGQQIIAENFYRPRLALIASRVAHRFADVPQMVTIDAAFGGWPRAQATHFADGGSFDQIYEQ